MNLFNVISYEDRGQGKKLKVSPIAVGLILLFVVWRVFGSGVVNSDRMEKRLSTAIIEDYKQAVYKEHGFYEDSEENRAKRKNFPWASFEDLTVEITDMKTSASLISFSAKDTVEFNYDYTLRSKGVLVEEKANVYSSIAGNNRHVVRSSNAFFFYANYIF